MIPSNSNVALKGDLADSSKEFQRLESGRLPSNWRSWFSEILGNSQAIHQTLETVAKVASSDGSVLIYGESGTGKELIASSIHRISHRKNKKFIALNCSAIPEALLEAELFGHEKGAFTGADKKRLGLFEAANGGTVFLDEIGDMPINLQAKLLRVLQEKEYTPLGSHEIKTVDVRIIAATNVQLEHAVKDKAFRADLFYRLNVFPVNLPPLRERLDDLEVLIEEFLKTANRIHRFAEPCVLNHRVLGFMRQYTWPGNVRELQNVIERMVVIRGGGTINIEHLPKEILNRTDIEQNKAVSMPQKAEIKAIPIQPKTVGQVMYPESFGGLPEGGMNLTSFIESLENKLILDALERTKNNKNQAAKLLGMNRTTLVERIKKRNIAPLNPPSQEL